MYIYIHIYIYIYICVCIYIYIYISDVAISEQLPNHRHRDLKASQEHIQTHDLLLRYRAIVL